MNRFLKSIGVSLVLLFSISAVSAETLTSKLEGGNKLRLGFVQLYRGLMLEIMVKL